MELVGGPGEAAWWSQRTSLHGTQLNTIQAELGTSLFEIALSLFALERTLILRAMALLETKSEAL